jgi:16S rRNA (cytosine967-C5)-methyltransferase
VIASADEKNSVRGIATEILLKVDTQKAYADFLLDHALKTTTLDERDRGLLTEVVYGTLRWRGTIDARLSRHLRRPLAEADPFIRNLLRLTLYQLSFLDKVPEYAAVNEAVELAKLRGGGKMAGFVNGVLRNLLREKDSSVEVFPASETSASLAEELSHPEWLVKRWLAEFGAEVAKALMRANNEKAPLVVRVNILKCSRVDLLERLLRAGVTAKPTQLSPQGILLDSGATIENLPGFSEGLFQVQGEVSQLVSYLLAPEPGERILDACAAPGGKSTHIAELMGDKGEIIALDPAARGLDRIRENTARLKIESVHPIRADAGRAVTPSSDEPYDRILVDAPCTGLGTLRSHPEIKWQRGESDIKRLSQLQSKILANVAGLLKPGGVLVYSTCTLSRDENEDVAEEFLHQHREFELEDAARYLPGETGHMTRGKYFQALPHRDNTDGFFAARMRKVC